MGDENGRGGRDGMVDWDLAVATAIRLAKPGPEVDRREAHRTVAALHELALAAEGHVRQFTGLAAPRLPDRVAVIDRHSWIRVNADGFRSVLSPLVDKLEARRDSMPGGSLVTAVGSRVTGLEAGALLAFLSSKVLGQYDLFAHTDGRLLLVAPNIVQAERDMGVDSRDFRLWVCIHEETHRVQFGAVPWLRAHVEGEIKAFLGATDVDPQALARRLRDGLAAVVGAIQGDESRSLIDVVQTPEQRVILDRLTAVMSLLEGHADFVMDGVGPDVIPSVEDIRRRFQKRRQGTGRLDQTLRRLLGVDAKIRQYTEGSSFVRGVVERVGMEGFNRVWTSAATLPTRDEIADPASWVDRVRPVHPQQSALTADPPSS
jgi:coenzyme F420 biosynthesis associated uncharacterized protein